MDARAVATVLRYVWRHPLNARGRIAAIGRVLRWQLRSRLQAGSIALPFVNGTRLHVRRGMQGATGNWYCGLHEAGEMALLLHLLRPGEHFLDVGANIGSYTVLAAGAVGGRVTAVEPVPETFADLQDNVLLNGLGERVRLCPLGLSSAAGTLRFTLGLSTVNRVMAADETGAGSVLPVQTVDALVGTDVPLLAKIDVEGHELAVLRGAARTLADPRLQVLIVETDPARAGAGAEDDALCALLLAAGFRACRYDPFTRTLEPGARRDRNTVFVRDLAWAAERVRRAPRFRLVNGVI